jgi:hypothetical protein
MLFGAVLAGPSVYPTGTTLYDPQKAWSGYVVFSAPDHKTRVIDMNGNVVHQWEYFGFPPELIDPANTRGEKGHLIVQSRNGDSPYGGIFSNEEVAELDWDGRIVWRWGAQAPGGKARQNHDWDRLPNGNTLLVTTVDRVVPGVSARPIADQVIREIDPQDKEVWSWTVGDHIDEFGISPEGRDLLRKVFANGGAGHGFLTINDLQPIGPNKWFDQGDARFDPANIVIDSREASFIAIISRKTGRIVWRLGPDYAETAQTAGGVASVASAALRPVLSTALPRPVDQTSGQHDAHIIAKGLPGEGNLLVFDNEGPSGYPATRIATQFGSRVLEINPITKQIVWQYTGLNSDAPVWSFFSSFISSARRLPNGNTLIDEGMNGRLFQVTPQGEIVWEYVNPYYARQKVGQDQEVRTNWVFRAQPVAYDWVPIAAKPRAVAVTPPDNGDFRVPARQIDGKVTSER